MKETEEYQRQVMGGLSLEHGTDPLTHCALGLAGEAGEVADLVKKSQYNGGRLRKADLKLELGDALWYLTSLAGQLGWTLEEIMAANVRKLEGRRGYPYNSAALRRASK